MEKQINCACPCQLWLAPPPPPLGQRPVDRRDMLIPPMRTGPLSLVEALLLLLLLSLLLRLSLHWPLQERPAHRAAKALAPQCCDLQRLCCRATGCHWLWSGQRLLYCLAQPPGG